MNAPRPRCPYCNKQAPKLATTVWVHRSDETVPRQRDDSWSRHLYVDEPLRSIAECRKHTNQQVISVHYGYPVDTISRFSEWDGESYWLRHGGMFCSNPCALDFAKAAYRAGYRMKEPVA